MRPTSLCREQAHTRCEVAELACGCPCHGKASSLPPAVVVLDSIPSPLHCPRCKGPTRRLSVHRAGELIDDALERCDSPRCGWELSLLLASL